MFNTPPLLCADYIRYEQTAPYQDTGQTTQQQHNVVGYPQVSFESHLALIAENFQIHHFSRISNLFVTIILSLTEAMEDRDVARLSDETLKVSTFSGDGIFKGAGLCFLVSPTIVATPFSGGSFSWIISTTGFCISVSPPGISGSSFCACKYQL